MKYQWEQIKSCIIIKAVQNSDILSHVISKYLRYGNPEALAENFLWAGFVAGGLFFACEIITYY